MKIFFVRCLFWSIACVISTAPFIDKLYAEPIRRSFSQKTTDKSREIPLFTDSFQLQVTPSKSQYGIQISLSSKAPGYHKSYPKLAIFKRGSYLWLVSNEHIFYDPQSTPDLPAGYSCPEILEPVTHFPTSSDAKAQKRQKSFAIRILIPKKHGVRLSSSIKQSVGKEGSQINFTLDEVPVGPQVAPPSLLNRFFLSEDQTGAGPTLPQLKIRIPQLDAIMVKDPMTQADLVILPTQQHREGIPWRIQYQDFHILPSIQGVVIFPLADGVRVLSRQDTIISKIGGLNCPNPKDFKSPSRFHSRLFNFENWFHKEESFSSVRQDLESKIVSSRSSERLKHQLALAKLFLVYKQGVEACGILEKVLETYPLLEEDKEIMSLRGLAFFMSHHFQAAAKIFSHPLLPREAKLWEGASLIEMGLAAQGLPLIKNHMQTILSYPPQIAADLYLLSADAALDIQEKELTYHFLKPLEDMSLSASQEMYRRNLNEQMHITLIADHPRDDRFSSRRAAWGVAEQNLAELSFEEINENFKEKRFTLQQAIKSLQNLKSFWKGGSLECAVTSELASLYQKAGQPFQSMDCHTEAVQNFSELPEASSNQLKGEELFCRTILSETPLLPPVKKVAFFNRFKEFLPQESDPKRQSIILNIAQVLVQMELPHQAIPLLEIEIKRNPPQGFPLWKNLILAYWKNEENKKALELFAQDIPPTLATEKKEWALMKAEALTREERLDEAIAVLKTQEDSLTKRSLSAHISWKKQNFPQAAKDLKSLLQYQESINTETLMRLAIALRHTGDLLSLQRLRASYKDIIASDEQRKLFLILTQPPEQSRPPSLEEMKKSLLRANEITDFLTRDKKRKSFSI